MGSVYRASIYTIAAVSGENSNAGCYARRNPLSNRPCWLSKKPALVAYIDEQVLHNTVPNQCLHSRGWVLQERLLSRRTFAFSKSGVFWDCQQQVANEEHTTYIPTEALDQNAVNLKRTMKVLQSSEKLLKGGLPDSVQFLGLWYEIARIYSKLDLTFATDKPVAFSGIAMCVEKWSGLTYYYGLWKEFVLHDLMWCTPYPYYDQANMGEVSRLEAGLFFYQHKRRLPTFTWLSSDVGIDYRVPYLRRSFDRSRKLATGDFVGMHTLYVPHEVDNKYHLEEIDIEILEKERENDPFTLVKRSQIMRDMDSSFLNTVELEFHTRVLQAHRPQGGGDSIPWIALYGPVLKFRTTKLGHVLGRSRWSHPYYSTQDILGMQDSTLTTEPERDTEKSNAENFSKTCRMVEIDPASGAYWFYPDDHIFEELSSGCWMDVVCITIARWVRQPQGNYYAGGLVLARSGMTAKSQRGDPMTVHERVGYFEHFWRSKSAYWEKSEDSQMVILT